MPKTQQQRRVAGPWVFAWGRPAYLPDGAPGLLSLSWLYDDKGLRHRVGVALTCGTWFAALTRLSTCDAPG